MLRVTTDDAVDRLVLRFEGRLTGAWVDEADTSWREATEKQPCRRIVVDLCDVSAVDDSGRELLTRMYRGGAEFSVRGCVMRELAWEIAQSVSTVAKEKLERATASEPRERSGAWGPRERACRGVRRGEAPRTRAEKVRKA